MSTPASFILAAGEQSRFTDGSVKQLLIIDPKSGESIIGRLARQLRFLGHTVNIVTHRKEIIGDTGLLGCGIIEPADRRFTCSSALSTAQWWTERTFIFLGDVYWSDDFLERFTEESLVCRPLYATDGTDIFGLTWRGDAENWNVSAAFKQVIAEGQPRYGGRLHASRKYLPEARYMTLPKGDRTQDFDTREEYLRFMEGISKRRPFVPLRSRCIAKG